MTNEQIAAMAAWTLEDFQNDPLVSVERVRELAAAHLTLQRERDAAVRDIEKIMRWDDTSVFCQFCKKDEVCDLNHTDCDPEWRGQQPEVNAEQGEPCEFCRDDRPKPLDTEEMEAEITQVTPFPAINLSTGEKEGTAAPPFYALRIFWNDDEYCMEDIVPIEFCPKCGRRLVSTRTYESILKQHMGAIKKG